MQRFQQTRTALGSSAAVTLVVADAQQADKLFADLWQRIDAFEQRFSRFKLDSELSQFNAGAGTKTAASPEFLELLVVCQAMAQETNGLFNPFVLPALQQAGYIGSWPNPTSYDTRLRYSADTKTPAITALEIGANWAKMPRGCALDFGGIGKGFLLDKLSWHLLENGVQTFWLSLGGDIVCSGHDAGKQPWAVGLQHATDPQQTIGEVTNSAGAVLAIATSGITKRKGERGGQAWHHIIDPRTEKPATTDVLTATITAECAMEADIYAKCLVILGSEQARQFVEAHHITQAYLQLANGKIEILQR